MSATITCQPLRLSYFLRIPNVGDRINPTIVEIVSNRPTTYVANNGIPHLVAAGSTMAATTLKSLVWGTGVMHPDYGVGGVVASNICAVRGKLSHTTLRQAGLELGEVPFGDPGYLAPSLLGITKCGAPTHKTGVVPHYVDRRNAHFCRLLTEPGVVDLNVHDDPVKFLHAMATCDAVISSSLHGLIFAEALGIPNLWVTAGEEIGGGRFKYDDWFSTTAKPQRAAHVLNTDDTAVQLSNCASLHECTIDINALKDAFPKDRVDELCEKIPRPLLPVDKCRSQPIPTFLISYNRGGVLKNVIASIKRLNRLTEIVIHDNGSTDADTLAILGELETSGTRVVRNNPISSADDLNYVNDTVQDYFSIWAEPSRYVVSDCDIDMAISAPETLDVYDELLNLNRQVACVGPMLRISDIPHSYPLFNRVINRHIEQFWHRQPDWIETSFGPVAYQLTGIDTTFALQRAGEPYRRLKEALRVYEPYEARHLDWYVEQIGSDTYSSTSSAAISHWNNISELKVHENVELEHSAYYIVRKGKSGELEVCEEHIVQRAGRILPFVDATEEQRVARISHTETLKNARSTDLERWQNAASHYESWQQRTKVLAGFLKPGERVFEFGAGHSVLPELISAKCSYKGSDAAPLKSNIAKFDLNAATLPELHGHDVSFFSGVLEYVHDLSRLTAFLSQHFRCAICSYAVHVNSSHEIERRRYSGWFNDLTEEEFCDLFRNAGFCLTQRAEWMGQILFRWDRR